MNCSRGIRAMASMQARIDDAAGLEMLPQHDLLIALEIGVGHGGEFSDLFED